jgi:two-component system, OmpR family, sensor histidine kinase SenX3
VLAPRDPAVFGPSVFNVIELSPWAVTALVAGIAVLLVAAVAAGRRVGRGPGAAARAESSQRLDRSLTLFRLALDEAPLGVVVGDDAGEVVFANATARRFIEGRHAETIVRSAVEDLLARGLSGEEASDTLDLYGPPRWNLVLSARPLHQGETAVGGVVIVEDVTERRRLEAVRRDFVANISHELKTPVGALGVLAETLGDEKEPDVIRRLSERIHHEAFRVNRMIDDLLELSRIEAEERPSREAVPVALIVADALDRARGASDARHTDVKVENTAGDAAIYGDRSQLVSALANLLDNAVKYSDPGSPVEIRTRRVSGTVEIEVEDHGIGIPSRDLDRIFERFYRVDRARSRGTGGTGLGLAIVRHVVNNHDGTVRVDSREGDGSTFTLVLPASGRFQSSLSEAS